ncbi:MFS transporter [Amycolatopsis benzoatilytica]|uniref:MFS transporter n=1 Tax=Amycolatopsis benzoatilytica TaxID=346045 RepID=UPI0003786CEB|nr:MFS transporter [Amycolatopsis benzoatilytica]
MNTHANPWPGLGAVVLGLVAAMTPVFTVASLATPVEHELHLSGVGFGLLLSGFYALTALGSPVARRVAGRFPVPILLLTMCAVSVVALVLATRGVVGLAIALLLAGAGNTLTQPAAARYIAARIPDHRLSVATGLTGAALGAAPLLPGLLAGLVAEPYGWRAALIVAIVVPVAAAAVSPLAKAGIAAPVAAEAAAPRKVGRGLVWWTVGAALATIGSNAVASFFVQLGTTAHLSPALAGTMLSVSSALAIAVRVAAGIRADRAPRRNPRAVAVMMASGALGLVLISLGHPVTFVLGAALAVAGGWGWTGLLLTAVMRVLPGQAARAGATVQLGLFGGAAVAPLAFGALSAAVGVAVSVLVIAGVTLLGALAVERGTATLFRKPGGRTPVAVPVPQGCAGR